MADAALAGADGCYSAVGDILPRKTLALFRAARAGDAAEARRIDGAFQPLWGLFKSLGGLRVIYAIANQLSLCVSDPLRPFCLCERERDLVGNAVRSIEKVFS